VRVVVSTKQDDREQERIDRISAVSERARRAGLTDEEIEILTGAKK
jgi:hypothetical protein